VIALLHRRKEGVEIDVHDEAGHAAMDPRLPE
jgi:hypothetical protein